MAQQNLIYTLQFNYLNQRYQVNVIESALEEDTTCYEVQFESCNCLFLSHYNQWKVIARFNICARLQQHVIKAIHSHKRRLTAKNEGGLKHMPLAINT
jgi:hypothetical protein